MHPVLLAALTKNPDDKKNRIPLTCDQLDRWTQLQRELDKLAQEIRRNK